MRTHIGTIITVAVALAIGAVVEWFAERACGGAAVSSKPPCRGDASLECSKGRACRPATAAAKPRCKALIRSSADTAEFAETLRAVGDATSGDMTN